MEKSKNKYSWIWWTLIVGLPLFLGSLVGWLYFNVVKKISFGVPTLANFSMNTVWYVLGQLAKGQGSVITIDLEVPIKNESNYDITFSGFKAEVSHNGKVIAKSNENPVNFQERVLKANEETKVIYTVDIIVTKELFQTLALFAGKEVEFGYKASVKVKYIPIPISHEGTFKFKL